MEHACSSSLAIQKRRDLQKRLPASEAGLYLVGKKYFRIEQQPAGNPAYVSDRNNIVTSFSLPKNYGNLGYLAHNDLAGSYFKDMGIGDEIIVLPEQGDYLRYRVTAILRYRALQPRNARSNFINLQTNQQCKAGEVFRQVYMGNEHVVLQTCIARDGLSEWGRLFVLAEPVERGQLVTNN